MWTAYHHLSRSPLPLHTLTLFLPLLTEGNQMAPSEASCRSSGPSARRAIN